MTKAAEVSSRSDSGRDDRSAASNRDDHLGELEHGFRFDYVRRGSGRTRGLETLVSAIDENRAADEDDVTLRLIPPDQRRRSETMNARQRCIHCHTAAVQ